VPVADAPAQQPAPAHRAPVARSSRARQDQLERSVRRAINRARARRGLPLLRSAPPIASVAAAHSYDQLRRGRLSHTSSNGTPFDARIRRVTVARTVGEVLISFRGRSTGRQVVRAWLRSPAHRAQLLGGAYRRVGVGRATSRGSTVVTADFASAR